MGRRDCRFGGSCGRNSRRCGRAGPGCGSAWMGRFFRQGVLRWLQARGVGYTIEVPFYRWLDLQRYIRAQPVWVPGTPNVTGFTISQAVTPWQIPVAVTIYRTKGAHGATKNYQLDLCDPNDGHYEYASVTRYLPPDRAESVVLHVRARQP